MTRNFLAIPAVTFLAVALAPSLSSQEKLVQLASSSISTSTQTPVALGLAEEEMARLLAKLVAVPSENPPGKNYQAVAKVLEKHIRGSGLDFKRLQSKTTRCQLTFILDGSGNHDGGSRRQSTPGDGAANRLLRIKELKALAAEPKAVM